MNSRLIRSLIPVLGLVAMTVLPLAADSRMGRISGVVLDESGVPQMGATVVIASHSLLASAPLHLFTNGRGHFVSSTLPAGAYTVSVTLAGFLPTLRPDVEVSTDQTTSLQIQMGSIFTGLTELRRRTDQRSDDGDWGWVLRAAAATRPILRWQDANSASSASSDRDPFTERALAEDKWHSRLDVSSGMRPGSANGFSDSPATAVAYQESVGADGQLLFAGQFSYESESPNGGFAAIWLPTGDTRNGPVSSAVVRQSRLGPDGPILRGVRLDQQGIIALDDNLTIRYGAEYLLTSLNNATTDGVRPRAELAVQLAPHWQASVLVASRPWPSQSPQAATPLESAVDSLDAFPTMLFHNGKPVLESGWHEELAVERLLRNNGRVMVAAFHDRSSNMAVYGQGTPANNSEFLQDFFSDGFAYDSGNADSFGMRAAYQQKVSDNLSATLVYAWAGALSPLTQIAPGSDLRDMLATRQLNSVAGSVSSRLPLVKTHVTAGYKWLSGMAVSRQDEFGEAYFGLDPYFNLVLHQPIPCMHRMQAVADFGNLLAQGYVPLTTRDGRVVLVSAYRTFRGGVSVQF